MNAVLLIILLVPNASGPQQYMQAGEVALQADNWPEVRTNFQAALHTNQLNDAGRAVSYWNLYWAEDQMGLTNPSMESLFGFIVCGSDYLNTYGMSVLAKRFGLKEKLSYAIAIIQATWAKGNNYSCRSANFPCYIESVRYIDVFQKIMPFCVNREVQKIRVVEEGPVLRADVTCVSTGNFYENYYFTTNNEY